MIILVTHPYGDFPDLKRGDVIVNPSPELLETARNSNNFEVVGADGDPPAPNNPDNCVGADGNPPAPNNTDNWPHGDLP